MTTAICYETTVTVQETGRFTHDQAVQLCALASNDDVLSDEANWPPQLRDAVAEAESSIRLRRELAATAVCPDLNLTTALAEHALLRHLAARYALQQCLLTAIRDLASDAEMVKDLVLAMEDHGQLLWRESIGHMLDIAPRMPEAMKLGAVSKIVDALAGV